MKKIISIALLLTISGCATRITTQTWVPVDGKAKITRDGMVSVKKTRVIHSWWLGLPAIAPMDQRFKDGDFEVETKAFQSPDFAFDSLWDKN